MLSKMNVKHNLEEDHITLRYLPMNHYRDVIMGVMASQITSVSIVYSTVASGRDQRNIKAPRYWPLWGEFTSDQWPVTSEFTPQGPVMGKMFPFNDAIMILLYGSLQIIIGTETGQALIIHDIVFTSTKWRSNIHISIHSKAKNN